MSKLSRNTTFYCPADICEILDALPDGQRSTYIQNAIRSAAKVNQMLSRLEVLDKRAAALLELYGADIMAKNRDFASQWDEEDGVKRDKGEEDE